MKTIHKYLNMSNIASHIVIHQLQEELAMTSRVPWISLIITILAMLYIGFATAFWPNPDPYDDVDLEECDDDCQHQEYLEDMVKEEESRQHELLEEARGIMQDSGQDLHIVINLSSNRCYGPTDLNSFTQGGDAYFHLKAQRNIMLDKQGFIILTWNKQFDFFDNFGNPMNEPGLEDLVAWGDGYDVDHDCGSAWGIPRKHSSRNAR